MAAAAAAAAAAAEHNEHALPATASSAGAADVPDFVSLSFVVCAVPLISYHVHLPGLSELVRGHVRGRQDGMIPKRKVPPDFLCRRAAVAPPPPPAQTRQRMMNGHVGAYFVAVLVVQSHCQR